MPFIASLSSDGSELYFCDHTRTEPRLRDLLAKVLGTNIRPSNINLDRTSLPHLLQRYLLTRNTVVPPQLEHL